MGQANSGLGSHEIADDHAAEALGIAAPPQTWQFLCLEAGLQNRIGFKVQSPMRFNYSQFLQLRKIFLAVRIC